MPIAHVIPQLRTTNLDAAIGFYVTRLGFTLEFVHQGFYAGVRSGEYRIHLKLVDEPDPSIAFVEHGDHLHLYLQTPDVSAAAAELKKNGVPLVRVHDTPWHTRECVIRDADGHTLYVGQPWPASGATDAA
jgi:catechol 2,3-dioxygenase-like lactoylglutathione lyase family enzyme